VMTRQPACLDLTVPPDRVTLCVSAWGRTQVSTP
jgi:hypothetical protein